MLTFGRQEDGDSVTGYLTAAKTREAGWVKIPFAIGHGKRAEARDRVSNVQKLAS